eukprot:11058975-Lingulodinium_polyedra.AAC.1
MRRPRAERAVCGICWACPLTERGALSASGAAGVAGPRSRSSIWGASSMAATALGWLRWVSSGGAR